MKTLRSELSKWMRANGQRVPNDKRTMKMNKKKRVKSKEKLSERELLNLMGVGMQTLKRGHGGAFKR